jgi:hypothetical protein
VGWGGVGGGVGGGAGPCQDTAGTLGGPFKEGAHLRPGLRLAQPCNLLEHTRATPPPPTQVCSYVGLCPSASPARRLLAAALGRRSRIGGGAAAAPPPAWAAAAAKLSSRYGGAAAPAGARPDAAPAAARPLTGALASALGAGADKPSPRGAGWKAGGRAQAAGSNDLACEFCNTAVEYVKIALRNNQTVEEIEEVILGGGG